MGLGCFQGTVCQKARICGAQAAYRLRRNANGSAIQHELVARDCEAESAAQPHKDWVLEFGLPAKALSVLKESIEPVRASATTGRIKTSRITYR